MPKKATAAVSPAGVEYVPSTEPVESRHDKFRRLAIHRMTATLKRIRQIGNLGTANYEYEPHEARQLIAALRAAVDEVEAKLAATKPKSKDFTFSAPSVDF